MDVRAGNSQLCPRRVCSPDKISPPVPGCWPLLCLKGCLSVIVGHWFCAEVTLSPTSCPFSLYLLQNWKAISAVPHIVAICQLLLVPSESIRRPYKYWFSSRCFPHMESLGNSRKYAGKLHGQADLQRNKMECDVRLVADEWRPCWQ